MESKVLNEGDIGSEGNYVVDYADKKIKITVSYDGAGGDAGMFLAIDAEYLLDKLAEKIPGKLDDMVINLIKEAL